MEELQARHRKEQRDLVAKITQKKKQASKKTRKGVNEECDILERELKERQQRESAELNGEYGASDGAVDAGVAEDHEADAAAEMAASSLRDVQSGVANLSLDTEAATKSNGLEEQPVAAQKRPNRAKARLARRAAEQEAIAAQAAEEAASMPDMKELERQKMQDEFKRRGLQEKIIRADGHCLYSAVADQLQTLDVDLEPRSDPSSEAGKQSGPNGVSAYKRVRQAAAAYIGEHPDDFVPFLEEPLDDYVRKVRDTGEWGGQLELTALAKTYRLGINVIQGDGRLESIEGATDDDDNKIIWLAYYRHGFGLGEHYNSLRRAP